MTERATKLCVLGWSMAAVGLEIWLLRGAWPGLPWLAAVACALVAVVAVFDRRIVSVVLALSYVAPALIYLHVGHYYPQYIAIWMALLLAAIAPASVRTGWHFPNRWRSPLIAWAIIAVVGASIVAIREIDFTPALFSVTSVANTSGGGWPAFIIRFVVHVALVTTVGILWVDWLWGAADLSFERDIAIPLACSAFILGLVSVYQLFFDVVFLNPTVYGNLKRAGGTVFDANVCGTLAALWLGGAVLVARQFPAKARYIIAIGTIAGWLAVWATGSRTGFAAAALVTLFNTIALVKWSGLSRARTGIAGSFAVVAVGVMLVVLARADFGVVGPVARFRATMPDLTVRGIGAEFYEQLWNRNGYGGASSAMIARFPWFGVGVGAFQSMLSEFVAYAGGPIPPDNAQNWYRHQLAELGMVGSIPWLLWVVAFGWYVLDLRRARTPESWVARGVLIAFAAISFVGMPGQEPIVAVTFWTFAFWFTSIARGDDSRPWPRRSVAALAAVVVLYATGTVLVARNDLRVPVRAQRVGWPYSYGFYNPETRTFGPGPGWTTRRAVLVFQPSSPWIALTVSTDYRQLTGSAFKGGSGHVLTRPTDVQLRCNGRLLLRTRLTTTAPSTTYVRLSPGERWIFLESSVSRGVPLRELGVDADGEIGVRIDWAPAAAPSSPDQSAVTCGGSDIARVSPPSNTDGPPQQARG